VDRGPLTAVFSTSDTIVAIATPPGRSGLGVVRLSGPEALPITGALIARTRGLKPRHATFARLAIPDRPADARAPHVGDQVVVIAFPGPQSYTGEDVAEISAHGSPVVLQSILRRAIDAGARLAEPGEFTLRAFLNGKIDLIQAEAVADLIDAVTPLQARAAFDQLEGTLTTTLGAIEGDLFDLMARLEASLDFPDEGYHFVETTRVASELGALRARLDALTTATARGRLMREGAQIAIVGTPNVGKSSLFNALLNAERAIVTPIPGTTRDLVTEQASLGGMAIALIDTAGVRASQDIVEQEGIARARGASAVADLTVVVLDRSRALTEDDRELVATTASRSRVVVANKSDLSPAWMPATTAIASVVEVSARTGDGLERLIDSIAAALGGEGPARDIPLVTNVRHATLVDAAREAIDHALEALGASGSATSEEFVLADLQQAAACLQEITGRRTTDDLLRHIFERFCIGK
jgi:tRNA modification GTPase